MNKKTLIYGLIGLVFIFSVLASYKISTSNNNKQANIQPQNQTAPIYQNNNTQSTQTYVIKPNTNSQNTSSNQLTEKCTPSYNYEKNFGVKVCIMLPQNWQQQALGYETHLVFKEDIYATDISPTVAINRHDATKYTSFDKYLSKNNQALLENYGGKIIQQEKGDNYYYLEAELQYGDQPIHAFAYYYNDTAHGYFWSTTLMLTPEQYAKYQSIAPTMVKSLTIK